MSPELVLENARHVLGCAEGESLAEGVLRIQAGFIERAQQIEKAISETEEALRSAPTVRALLAAETVLHELAKKGHLAAGLALEIVQPVACEFSPELFAERVSILDIVSMGDGNGIRIRNRAPHWFVNIIVDSLKESIKPGPNYVEMRFTDPRGEHEDIIATLQREGKITPHNARLEAEARAKALAAELETVKMERDDLRAVADAATSLRFGSFCVTKSSTGAPDVYVLRDIRTEKISDLSGRPRAEAIAEARRLDAKEKAAAGGAP